MSRKLATVFFSLFALSFTSGTSKDLPDLVRQVNQVSRSIQSCPDLRKSVTAVDRCRNAALFICELHGGAKDQDREALKKKFEEALRAYYSRDGKLAAFGQLASGMGFPCASKSCFDATVAKLAEKLSLAKSQEDRPANLPESADTAMNFEKVMEQLDQEPVRALFGEVCT